MHQNQPPDDLVSRGVVAARQLPILDGPPPATIERTLAALRAVANRRKPTTLQKIYRLPWKSTAAALLGLAASALVAYLALSASSSRSQAWAEAIDKILAAKTLISDMVIHAGGENGLVCKGRLLFDETNNTRAEMHIEYQKQVDDATLILNVTAGKCIMFIKGQKMAVTDMMKIGDQNLLKDTALDRIKAIAKEGSQSLGKKEIDGVQCEGFEVRRGVTVRLWVNVATGDPVRLEEENLALPQPLGRANVVVSNFRINEKIDPSLFDADPPEGYSVLKSPITIDLTGSPANDLAVYLKEYAKESGGRFPERLLDPGDATFKKLDTTSDNRKEQPTADNMQRALGQAAVLRLQMYLTARKQGTDYQYYPGITLGEKDRIVFWSRSTRTGDYTALYGDLRVEKIDKDKVPPPLENDGKN